MMRSLLNRSADEQIREMGARIPRYLRETNVPGLSLALVRDRAIAAQMAFGVKDKATAAPMDTATVFQGASLSKPIFAVAVLRLWDEGRLDLDAPLRDYLPCPYEPRDPAIDRITARMVLCHTTGLPNWRTGGQGLRTLSPPGARFGYSGEGFVYLQRTVERIAAEPLDRYARRVVLDPLGMTSTEYVWSVAYDAHIAVGHRADGSPYGIRRPSAPNAAHSVHTTPRDVARLLLALVAPPADGPILRPETIAAMLRPQVAIRQNPALAWTLGWGLQRTADGSAIWQWGDNPGFKNLVFAFPERGFGIVLMTNGDNGLKVCERILREIVGGDYPLFSAIHRPTLALEHSLAASEDGP